MCELLVNNSCPVVLFIIFDSSRIVTQESSWIWTTLSMSVYIGSMSHSLAIFSVSVTLVFSYFCILQLHDRFANGSS